MKIYVSGPFANRGSINLLIKGIESQDHIITYDWTIDKNRDKTHEDYQEGAEKVLNAIKEADVLICVFNNSKDISRGIFTEIGIALSQDKPVLVFNIDNVSNPLWLTSNRIETCLYYHHKNVEIYTVWGQLMKRLREM